MSEQDRQDQIDQIFLDAIDVARQERQAFLEQQREHIAPDILREVWRLLEKDEATTHARMGANPYLNLGQFEATHRDAGGEEELGTQIGNYHLLQKLGEGGMGVVYMADQTKPVKRRVALKVVKPGMDSKAIVARFEAERQALALMEHPNIAKVLDAGTTDSGRPYFVMELVRGVPITTYCQHKKLSIQARLALFESVCRAVQHAHQKGIIHRDLKPSNVLVADFDDMPVPKVIDFGLAKAFQQSLTDRTLFTQLGQIVGTFEYMSPEQAKLNQLDIDTRTDIYSLGVLLYELLSGTTPFDQKRLRSAAFDEMLRIIREEDPPKPSTRVSDHRLANNTGSDAVGGASPRYLRGELDWIVMKALDKDRSRRYQSANDFANDVRNHLTGVAVEACPPSASYRLRKLARRYRRSLSAVCTVIFVLLSATIFSSYQWKQNSELAADLARKRDEAKSASASNQELARKTQQAYREATVSRLAYQSHRVREEKPNTGLLLALESVKLSQGYQNVALPIAHEALLNAVPDISGRALKGHTSSIRRMVMTTDWLVTLDQAHVRIWDYSSLDTQIDSHVLGNVEDLVTCMACTVDGRWLFAGGSKLLRWDLKNIHLPARQLSSKGSDFASISVTADGHRLLSLRVDGTVELWNADAINEAEPIKLDFGIAVSDSPFPKISPDGRWAAACSDVDVGLLDLSQPNNAPLTLPRNEFNGRIGSLKISQDGQWMIVGYQANLARVLNLTKADPTVAPSEFQANYHGWVFRPYTTYDGRWLFVPGSPEVRGWDLKGQEFSSPALVLRGGKLSTLSLAGSIDGRRLIMGGRDGFVRIWDLEHPNREHPITTLRGHDAEVIAVATSPCDRWIASADSMGTLRLWDVHGTNPAYSPMVLRGNEDDSYSDSAISSDGRWVATIKSDGIVQLWDLAQTDPSRTSYMLDGDGTHFASLRISSNDRWLAAGSPDGTARVWDLQSHDVTASGLLLGVHAPSGRRLHEEAGIVAFNRTSRWLATSGADGQVALWDIERGFASTPKPLELQGDHWPIFDMKFTGNGRWLVAAGYKDQVSVWDTDSEDILASHRSIAHDGDCFSLSVDEDSHIAVASSLNVYFWDVSEPNPAGSQFVVEGRHIEKKVWQTALSPSRRWLLISRFNEPAELWDLAEAPAKLHQLERPAQTAVFSADGRWLVTATPSGITELRDVTAEDPKSTLRTIYAHDAPIWSLAISRNSRWLISDSSDGTVRRYDLNLTELMKTAQAIAGRELTADEKRIFQIP